MPPTFQAVPIFRMFDLAKAREFYAGFLGFHVDWGPASTRPPATGSCST